MIIKARFKDLDKVKTSISNNADLLDDEIDKLIDTVASLKDNWDGGEASRIFIDTVNTYLNNMKTVPSIYRDFSTIINFMNTNYYALDNAYAESLKRGVVEHE